MCPVNFRRAARTYICCYLFLFGWRYKNVYLKSLQTSWCPPILQYQQTAVSKGWVRWFTDQQLYNQYYYTLWDWKAFIEELPAVPCLTCSVPAVQRNEHCQCVFSSLCLNMPLTNHIALWWSSSSGCSKHTLWVLRRVCVSNDMNSDSMDDVLRLFMSAGFFCTRRL